MKITRRRALIQGGAAVGALAAPQTLWSAPPPPSVGAIDAHCHFFNAADLPVRGFLKQALLRPWSREVRDTPLREQLGALSDELVDALIAAAPTADEEMAGACSGRRVSAEPLSDAAFADRLADALIRAVEGPVRAPERRRRLLEGLRLDPDLRALSRERALRLAQELLREDAAPSENGVQIDEALRRYARWARLLTLPRREILARYAALYGQSEARPEGVAFAAPALVDFDRWLDDGPASGSSHRCQVEAASRLFRGGPFPVHGFVGFDPWRAAVEGSDSFELVRAAVEDLGFLGVKIYPSMGFRPFANAAARDGYDRYGFGAPAAFARALDGALARLFAYCEAAQIPILAHAADSYGAGEGYGARAHPGGWRPALAAYPKLKVLLAHFGDFSGRDAAAWNEGFERAIAAGEGVHVDLSYNLAAMRRLVTRLNRDVRGLRGFARALPGATRRFLFGTDWIFIGLERDHERYLEGFDRLLRFALREETARRAVMRGNALRFFGLSPGTKAWERLERFYRRESLDFDQLRALAGA